MKFIRIGNIDISIDDIITIYRDYIEYSYELKQRLHYVRIVTREITIQADEDVQSAASVSACHDFEHGTPEADAVLRWLGMRTQVLYAKKQEEAISEEERIEARAQHWHDRKAIERDLPVMGM